MTNLVWSPSALQDVQRVYRFLANKDQAAARRAVKAIRESIQHISQHPEIGRPVDEMPIEFREWLVNFGNSGYIVLYHYDDKNAMILAVRHQKEAGY